MLSEDSPLLDESAAALSDHDKVYRRFTPKQKRTIVLIVSWGGILPLFVSGSFVPSIPQIARELGSTGSIINLAVSLSLFSGAVSSLVWATYSGYYGRRPIYLVSAPCLSIGSLGVAMSGSVYSLMAWRVVQAVGASSGFSVGAGVIGDIYKLEERGTALGVFFGASLSGAAFAPVAGGLAAHYASWRTMQYVLFANGLAALVAVALFLPETSHPGTRGVDKVAETGRRTWVWLNPFRCLALLRAPTMAAITVVAICVLLTDFVLLIPLSYTIGARYNITNEALIGSFFIAAGVGNICGAPVSGKISDHIVVKWRKLRGGEWVPEDRLRGTLFPAFLLVPMSILLCGLTTQFIPGRLGIVLNVLCLFMNGIGVDLVLAPISAYVVDILHSRSAEAMAAHKGIRNLAVSITISPILPLINMIGVARTNALAALVAWLGAVVLWCTIAYGDKMRAWVDVGYSTIEDN
ncbi:MFS general substrate transporter [Obba rivulosa]|uniref:MFS general substrate transporter n=1 Tax=Obba rivulosa TaxID=1052685 RepID=A0A8E2DGM7_9APHY|nr:MFS general substrate transporter [Obba rivulosa]